MALSPSTKRVAYSRLFLLHKTALPIQGKKRILYDATPGRFLAAYRQMDGKITEAGATAICMLILGQDVFVQGGNPANGVDQQTVNAYLRAIAPVIGRELTEIYPLEAKLYTPTTSIMAPDLHWATISSQDANTREVIDHTTRVVVKAYGRQKQGRTAGGLLSLLTAVPGQRDYTRNASAAVDMVNDFMLGYFLKQLITDYTMVVTPHFAFTLDWFIGPDFDGDAVRYPRDADRRPRPPTAIPFLPNNPPVQYVVVERADLTLGAYARGGLFSYPGLLSILYQLFFSLEAAWQTMGFLHHDLHMENVMLRKLEEEPESPYLGRTWIYKRADSATHAYITPDYHTNLFVEIIDFGRARAFIRDTTGGKKVAHVLVGNPMLPEYGICTMSQRRGCRVDPSWDTRRIGFDMVMTSFSNATKYESKMRSGPEQIVGGAKKSGALLDDAEGVLARLGDDVMDLLALAGDVRALIVAMALYHGLVVSGDPASAQFLAPKLRSQARGTPGLAQKILDAIPVDTLRIPTSKMSRGVRLDIMDVVYATLRSANLLGDPYEIFAGELLWEFLFTDEDTPWVDRDITPTLILEHPAFTRFSHANWASSSVDPLGVPVGFVDADALEIDPETGKKRRRPLASRRQRRNVFVAPVDDSDDEMEIEGGGALACTMCGALATGHANGTPFCGEDCLFLSTALGV